MELAEKIARYSVSLKYSDLPSATVHSVERALVDTFGCAIGASEEKSITIALDVLQRGGSSTVLGRKWKAAPELAAFINGGMARYFDYNDDYDAKDFSHPSDNIMPLIAVAEAEGKSGKDALLAIVLAYELQCRLVDAAALWKNGWDHVNYGIVSIAAAVSKLMGLTVQQTEQAINIALSSHISMRQVREGRISMWKAFAFSNAARNAIFAAQLARNGMDGPAPIFEGKSGFFNCLSGRFGLRLGKAHFRINDTTIKFYPAEMRAQSAIYCAIELKRYINKVSDIEEITIRTTEGGYKILGSGKEKWSPTNKETADHSLPYVVAAALAYGKLTVDSYSKDNLGSKDIRTLMGRTKVQIAKEFVSGDVHMESNEVTVRLKNGKHIKKLMLYPKGHPKNPLIDDDINSKFRSLAGRRLKGGQIEKALEMLWNFRNIKIMGQIFSIVNLS